MFKETIYDAGHKIFDIQTIKQIIYNIRMKYFRYLKTMKFKIIIWGFL